jgi:hypothetical protein
MTARKAKELQQERMTAKRIAGKRWELRRENEFENCGEEDM